MPPDDQSPAPETAEPAGGGHERPASRHKGHKY